MRLGSDGSMVVYGITGCTINLFIHVINQFMYTCMSTVGNLFVWWGVMYKGSGNSRFCRATAVVACLHLPPCEHIAAFNLAPRPKLPSISRLGEATLKPTHQHSNYHDTESTSLHHHFDTTSTTTPHKHHFGPNPLKWYVQPIGPCSGSSECATTGLRRDGAKPKIGRALVNNNISRSVSLRQSSSHSR